MAVVESDQVLEAVRAKAESAGVFGPITLSGGSLRCEAAASAETAVYELACESDGWWVSLSMTDRWQSESIESDLMHSGDKLEELLDEELAELGYEFEDGRAPTYQHFRSDDMRFVFRSLVPLADDATQTAITEITTVWLLAYEACFRQLGDMDAEDNED